MNQNRQLRIPGRQQRARGPAPSRGISMPDNRRISRTQQQWAAMANPGGPLPVQRKVGFEFQTDVNFTKYWESHNIPYNFEVFTPSGGNWKVVNDNKEMEFVTEPFEENQAGKGKLTKSIQDMMEILNLTVEATKNNTKPKVSKFIPKSKGAVHSDGIWSIYIDAPTPLSLKSVRARPQFSGGVTLENLPQLMEKASKTKMDFLKQSRIYKRDSPYIKKAQDLAQEKGPTYQDETGLDIGEMPYTLTPTYAESVLPLMIANISKTVLDEYIKTEYTDKLKQAPAHGFKKLKGLLSMLVLYLIRANTMNKKQPYSYSKAAFSIMHRTSFKAMYDTLENVEKKWFTPDRILAIANMTKDEAKPVFKRGFGHGEDVRQGPGKKEWLESVRSGSGSGSKAKSDLLSKGSGSSVVAGHSGSSSSMGAFDEMDTSLAGRKELAVFEFRALPNPVGVEDWLPMANIVFDVMKSINNPGD